MGLKSKFGKCINIPQIKALLWKDVLIKIRQPVSTYTQHVLFIRHTIKNNSLDNIMLLLFYLQWMTVLQFLWPCMIFVAMYALRLKYSAYEVNECQFPTRVLPAPSSLLPFLQSYICTIDNECSNTSKYEEISKFNDAPYVFF